MNENDFIEKVNEIVLLLKERGYEPYDQIYGYLETGLDTYITRYGDARNKIKQLNKTKLREYIKSIVVT